MTEDEARAALAAFDGLGGLERWIAEQRPWEATPGGWTVPGESPSLLTRRRRPLRVVTVKRPLGFANALPAFPRWPHRAHGRRPGYRRWSARPRHAGRGGVLLSAAETGRVQGLHMNPIH